MNSFNPPYSDLYWREYFTHTVLVALERSARVVNRQSYYDKRIYRECPQCAGDIEPQYLRKPWCHLSDHSSIRYNPGLGFYVRCPCFLPDFYVCWDCGIQSDPTPRVWKEYWREVDTPYRKLDPIGTLATKLSSEMQRRRESVLAALDQYLIPDLCKLTLEHSDLGQQDFWRTYYSNIVLPSYSWLEICADCKNSDVDHCVYIKPNRSITVLYRGLYRDRMFVKKRWVCRECGKD